MTKDLDHTTELDHTTPVARSNILKLEFTQPRVGAAHVILYREPKNPGKVCDAVVQLSLYGRMADVAKVWPNDRLDLHLDPGHYHLNVYSAMCGTPPASIDLYLSTGEIIAYQLFTGEFNMTLTPVHADY